MKPLEIRGLDARNALFSFYTRELGMPRTRDCIKVGSTAELAPVIHFLPHAGPYAARLPA
jgi:hypothetical protein